MNIPDTYLQKPTDPTTEIIEVHSDYSDEMRRDQDDNNFRSSEELKKQMRQEMDLDLDDQIIEDQTNNNYNNYKDDAMEIDDEEEDFIFIDGQKVPVEKNDEIELRQQKRFLSKNLLADSIKTQPKVIAKPLKIKKTASKNFTNLTEILGSIKKRKTDVEDRIEYCEKEEIRIRNLKDKYDPSKVNTDNLDYQFVQECRYFCSDLLEMLEVKIRVLEN